MRADQAGLLYLQRTAGNQLALRVLTSRDHEHVAAHSDSWPSGSGLIQRCGPIPCDCGEVGASEDHAFTGKQPVQRALAREGGRAGPEGGPVSADLARELQSRRGLGAGLEAEVRMSMEAAFGTRFNDVRIHTDPAADHLSRRLHALAFTTGTAIFFRQGAYSPGSNASRRLLAHELAHVVQQRGMTSNGPLTVGRADDTHELEADAAGRAALLGRVSVSGPVSDGSLIQRQSDNEYTYGEIGKWAITSLKDFTPPAGLADAKASIGVVCGRRDQTCRSKDGSKATEPGDQHAWSNIVAATGGADQTGGGHYMCVGHEGCTIVHKCTGCADGHRREEDRPAKLNASGSVTVKTATGDHTIYFYDDPNKGWCTHDQFIHGCTLPAPHHAPPHAPPH